MYLDSQCLQKCSFKFHSSARIPRSKSNSKTGLLCYIGGEISPPASGWRVLLFPTRADLGCIGRWHHLMSICCTLGMAWAPSCAYMYCTCVSLFDHTTSMCVFVLFIDNSQGNKRWKLCVRNMQAILFHPLVFHAQFLIDCRYVMNGFTDRCVKRLVTLLSYYARLWSLKVGSLYTSR